jgi:hypothetical protein
MGHSRPMAINQSLGDLYTALGGWSFRVLIKYDSGLRRITCSLHCGFHCVSFLCYIKSLNNFQPPCEVAVSVHHNIHNTILPNIGGPQYHRGVRVYVLYYPQYAIPHIVLLTIY